MTATANGNKDYFAAQAATTTMEGSHGVVALQSPLLKRSKVEKEEEGGLRNPGFDLNLPQQPDSSHSGIGDHEKDRGGETGAKGGAPPPVAADTATTTTATATAASFATALDAFLVEEEGPVGDVIPRTKLGSSSSSLSSEDGGENEEEDGEECEGDVSILLSHSMAAQGESSRKRKHRRSAALFPSALLKPISRISFLTAGMGMELEGGALGGLKSVGGGEGGGVATRRSLTSLSSGALLSDSCFTAVSPIEIFFSTKVTLAFMEEEIKAAALRSSLPPILTVSTESELFDAAPQSTSSEIEFIDVSTGSLNGGGGGGEEDLSQTPGYDEDGARCIPSSSRATMVMKKQQPQQCLHSLTAGKPFNNNTSARFMTPDEDRLLFSLIHRLGPLQKVQKLHFSKVFPVRNLSSLYQRFRRAAKCEQAILQEAAQLWSPIYSPVPSLKTAEGGVDGKVSQGEADVVREKEVVGGDRVEREEEEEEVEVITHGYQFGPPLVDFTKAEKQLLIDAVDVYGTMWDWISSSVLPHRGPAALAELYRCHVLAPKAKTALVAEHAKHTSTATPSGDSTSPSSFFPLPMPSAQTDLPPLLPPHLPLAQKYFPELRFTAGSGSAERTYLQFNRDEVEKDEGKRQEGEEDDDGGHLRVNAASLALDRISRKPSYLRNQLLSRVHADTLQCLRLGTSTRGLYTRHSSSSSSSSSSTSHRPLFSFATSSTTTTTTTSSSYQSKEANQVTVAKAPLSSLVVSSSAPQSASPPVDVAAFQWMEGFMGGEGRSKGLVRSILGIREEEEEDPVRLSTSSKSGFAASGAIQHSSKKGEEVSGGGGDAKAVPKGQQRMRPPPKHRREKGAVKAVGEEDLHDPPLVFPSSAPPTTNVGDFYFSSMPGFTEGGGQHSALFHLHHHPSLGDTPLRVRSGGGEKKKLVGSGDNFADAELGAAANSLAAIFRHSPHRSSTPWWESSAPGKNSQQQLQQHSYPPPILPDPPVPHQSTVSPPRNPPKSSSSKSNSPQALLLGLKGTFPPQ